MRNTCIATAVCCLTMGLPAFAAEKDAAKNKAEAQAAAPDNTKRNKQDRNRSEATADQQKENSGDRELTRRIRRAILEEKALSTYAHNVKVISQGGMVTLKGPVHTTQERETIAAKAAEIAGSGNVRNEITVKGDTKK